MMTELKSQIAAIDQTRHRDAERLLFHEWAASIINYKEHCLSALNRIEQLIPFPLAVHDDGRMRWPGLLRFFLKGRTGLKVHPDSPHG